MSTSRQKEGVLGRLALSDMLLRLSEDRLLLPAEKNVGLDGPAVESRDVWRCMLLRNGLPTELLLSWDSVSVESGSAQLQAGHWQSTAAVAARHEGCLLTRGAAGDRAKPGRSGGTGKAPGQQGHMPALGAVLEGRHLGQASRAGVQAGSRDHALLPPQGLLYV